MKGSGKKPFSVVIAINRQVVSLGEVIFIDDDQVHVVTDFATFIELLMVSIQFINVDIIDTSAELTNVG